MKSGPKLPAMPFFIQDYFGDVAVRLTPPDMRLVWVEMFLLMFDSPERGVLLKPNGSAYTAVELAKAINVPEELIERTTKHVIHEHIASVDRRTGALVSRKLIRAELRRRSAKKSGKMGGNPRLFPKKTGGKSGGFRPEKPEKSTPASDRKDNGLAETVKRSDKQPEQNPLARARVSHSHSHPHSHSSLKSVPILERSFAPLQPARANDTHPPGGNGNGNWDLGKLYFRLWAPFEGWLRKEIAPDHFAMYAGARIVELSADAVRIAVQRELIDDLGGKEKADAAMEDAITKSGSDMLRGRRVRLVTIDELLHEALS